MRAIGSILKLGASHKLDFVRSKTAVAAAFKALRLEKDCNLQDARNAFITYAKEYHPDSGSPKANGEKFSEYSAAYKLVVSELKSKEAEDTLIIEEEEYSIEEILKETIPIAHRKYLTNDGIGYGTPSQRQKQYQAYRLNRASTMVSEYKIQKLQRDVEGSKMLTVKEFAKRSKTSHFVDRVVEDMIQESMAKGEFKDLKGGKIENRSLPYVDQHEFHLNRVLINNGYMPEWVQAKQDIQKELEKAREILLKERMRFHTPPHSKISKTRWEEKRADFRKSIETINMDIQVFNLITPLPKTQMLLLKPENELDFVEKEFEKYLASEEYAKQEAEREQVSDYENESPLFLAIKRFLSL